MDSTTHGIEPNALAERHLYLVGHIVRQLAAGFPPHVDRDELRGAGAAGLVEAAHRYDPSMEVPFARYASIRIGGAIIDATRHRDWASRRLRRELRSIESAVAALEVRLQREPDEEEVAAELGVDVDTIRGHRAAATTSVLLSLDRPVADDTGDVLPLGGLIEETDEYRLPEPALERSELTGALRAALQHLPELLQQVLIEHQFEGRLLREIADDLGVTEARVSQLRQEALHALRAYLGTVFEDVPPVPADAPGKQRRAAFVRQVTTMSDWRSRLDHQSSIDPPDEGALGALA